MPESQRRPTLRSYTSGNSYFYFALFLGAIILVASATLGGYKKNLTEKIDAVRGQLSAQEKARVAEQEKALVAASKQSKIMKQLLDNKLYWSQALQRIEQMMQVSVKLTGVDATAEKGIVSFRASADSYASVARQLAAFAAASGVKDMVINNIESTTGGSVLFAGDLIIDTKAILMKTKPSPSPKPTQ